VVSAFRWLSPAQAARSFHDAGAEISALCPDGHALGRLAFAKGIYRYSALRPLQSLAAGLIAASPDLIIPCDDVVTAQLQQLYDTADDGMKNLLIRSLGAAENFPLIYSRDGLARMARDLGIATPLSEPVPDRRELDEKLKLCGLPAVLKIDGSGGGRGVAIIRSKAETGAAFSGLRAWPGWLRALKHLLVNRDGALMRRMLDSAPNKLSLQQFVEGGLANAAVACWQGEVLAAVMVEVLKTDTPTGPATLVKVISHPGMTATIEKMVRKLGLSGLCGFDFILGADNGIAQFIELNPRATPTCHLITADGKSLSQSLCARLRGDKTPLPALTPDLGPQILFPRTARRSVRAARETERLRAAAPAGFASPDPQ
jgi:hypothetical protein